MKTVKELYEFIDSHASHVMFEYNGRSCGIDPLSDDDIDMWYGDRSEKFTSIEDAFDSPFFDGKTISQIFDIIDLEW